MTFRMPKTRKRREQKPPVGFHSDHPVSSATAELLGNKYIALKASIFATRVWNELFDDQDRQLFQDLESAFRRLGTVGMWMKARDVSLPVAILQLAAELELLSPKMIEKVQRELGLDRASDSSKELRPSWDRDTGNLTYAGEVVKRIRNLSIAKNVVMVLNVFEEEGWPPRILDPLPSNKKADALRSLNNQLMRIRFRADGTGEGILWESTDR